MSAIQIHSQGEKREQFTAPVKCKCGQSGTAIWERNIEMTSGPQPVLLGVSSGFFVRINKKDAHTGEIACDRCERTVGISTRTAAFIEAHRER